MSVPKHSASVQDPLRHHGYRQSSAPLQQAQVLEGVEAQIQGRIHQNSIIPVWTGTDSTRIINGLLWLSPSLLQEQTFLMRRVSLLSLSAGLFFQPNAILAPSILVSSVRSGTFSRPISVPLLSFLSLLLSPSPSASYSCCHPHRTSQKCADSGCWATLPYYWSFKWNPHKAACDWSAFQWGGAAAMLCDHMSLYTSFVQINMSFRGLHVSLSQRTGNVELFDSSRLWKHYIKHKCT